MPRFLLVTIAAACILACSHHTAMVQTGDAAPVPAPSAAPPAPTGFWSDTIRQWSTLGKGWNRIPGRFGTGCAHDTIYAFKVRPGLTDKVLIFLNGGGMCWRSATCDAKKGALVLTADDPANDVSVRGGILDYANEKNPVRDWTMVFVPYCTGDAQLGTSEVEYIQPGQKSDGKTFKFRHGGAANIEAVMDWVYVNLKRPSTVLVAGSDAGAIASPVVAARMARHYPRARIVQLGDGAGAYRSDSIPGMMAIWGATDYLQHDPSFRSLDSASATFQQLYLMAARSSSRIHFAQVNYVDDPVQLAFLGSLGVKTTSLVKPLAANFTELKAGTQWFHTFTAPGKTHALLRSNGIYTLKEDGKPFIDWMTSLVNGDEVDDVGTTLLAPAKPAKPVKKKP